MSFLTVIQTKTYTCHISTLPKSISNKSVSKKSLMALENRFVDVEISFCHTFSYSDLQCLPPGDPKTLRVQTGIRLLAIHSISVELVTQHLKRSY